MSAPSTLTPPVAPRRPHPIAQHGHTRNDEYFWLRDRADPAVLAYLQAENAYTAAVMAPTQALQERLFQEMRGRLADDDVSVPVRHGPYDYYTRFSAGRQYPVYCRRLGADGPEAVTLDVNALAEGHDFCRLGNYEVSPDQRYLAYSVDFSGAERFTLHVKDLTTGAVLPVQFADTYYTLAWANDSRTLFFTTVDAATRPHRVWRWVVGAEAAAQLIHEERDESYFVWLHASRSRRYLFLHAHNNTTSEWRTLPADDPAGAFTVFAARRPGVEYKLDHQVTGAGRERWLFLTNDSAENFRLRAAPVGDQALEAAEDVLPHRPAVLLDGFDVFQDFLVVYEREAGLRHIRISDPAGGQARRVAFPEPAYNFWTTAWMGPDENPDYAAHQLRFTYSSLVTPDSVIDYSLADGTWTVRKQMAIPSGYDPAQYQAERLTATAPDGTAVPISLVYRRGFQRDGRAPLLLTGYGAYGASSDPVFSTNRLSLLDRGLAFAIAHVRGGSELGRAWYEAGKLLHKQNTFSDFCACAEHLIADGTTSADRLAALGVSAGGLLMGAVFTQRPELFGCVVAKVPFVDVLNSLSDPSIPLTVVEWEEWGNPADPAQFEAMRAYSPYDNLTARAYPALLVTAGLNDPRVAYWEPAKFVARLRTRHTGTAPVLLKTNLGAGHAGTSGRYDYLKEIAFEYAFILTTLGINA